jgi:hypothetical protein
VRIGASRPWPVLNSIVILMAMMAFGTASGIAIQGIEQNNTSWGV